MKVSSLFLILIFSVNVVAQTSQGTLFRIWGKHLKEGYMDVSGRVVIRPRFDEVTEFSEGLAAVRVGKKWGYIDRTGKVVIPPRWHEAGPFSEDLAVVTRSSGEPCGYINRRGQYMIRPLSGRMCNPFSDGLALVWFFNEGATSEHTLRRFGYLDRAGRWAVEPRFGRAADFKDGLALVGSGPDVRDDYLIDRTGRRVSNVKDCRWRYEFSEGLALLNVPEREPRYQVFINEKCEPVFKLPPEIRARDHFSEGLALVSQVVAGKNLFGYIDRTGKVVIPIQFWRANSFSEGLAGVVVQEKGKSYEAYINREGQIAFKVNTGIAPFKNGLSFHLLSLVTIRGPMPINIHGYMNKQGKYVWLSPGAEYLLEKEWIQKNYVGAKPRRRE